MDRGYNRENNYLSKRAYILKQATKVTTPLLDLPPKQVEDIVEAVHNHQFKALLQKTKTCTEVSIAGLGTYYMSPKAIQRLINKINNKILRLKRTMSPPEEIAQCEQDIAQLNQKLEQYHEYKEVKRVRHDNAEGYKKSPAPIESPDNQAQDGE